MCIYPNATKTPLKMNGNDYISKLMNVDSTLLSIQFTIQQFAGVVKNCPKKGKFRMYLSDTIVMNLKMFKIVLLASMDENLCFN